jgi:hypothetical protein
MQAQSSSASHALRNRWSSVVQRYYDESAGSHGFWKRVTSYVRVSRDKVLDKGLSHFWFKRWFLVAIAALGAVAVGVVLVARSNINIDTFLNYFALGLLIFVGITLFYGIIAIHDVPYEIAKHRNHPHQDAIHAAGWVSLFTLHALWPFLWIWAMLYRPDRGWGVEIDPRSHENAPHGNPAALKQLEARLEKIEARLKRGSR